MTRRKALILFLILCLQFQVAAAFVMPCAHQDAVEGSALTMACHQADLDQPSSVDKKEHFSCIKCVLGCMSGGFQALTAARGSAVLNIGLPIDTVFHPQHYYRFVPEQPKRPPIV